MEEENKPGEWYDHVTAEFMEEEFDLSEWLVYIEERKAWFVSKKGLKEFIKRLKEELKGAKARLEPIIKKEYPCFSWNILEKLDKLAGEKLIK